MEGLRSPFHTPKIYAANDKKHLVHGVKLVSHNNSEPIRL